jgi:hypothetical protein
MLAEVVVLSMSPMPEWFAGRSAGRSFFAWAPGPLGLVETGANTHPAFGLYGRSPDGEGYTPQAIQVLTLDGARIARLHGFVRPDLFAVFGLPARLYLRAEPYDEEGAERVRVVLADRTDVPKIVRGAKQPTCARARLMPCRTIERATRVVTVAGTSR